MAFLDNSGDIILDAVLTELGRRKMADGAFKITKFALGDDEIDYSLYNLDHASGSAYYDLEILQTPSLEATTGGEAGISYGLLTNTATDILYLPVLDVNKKDLTNTVQTHAGAPGIYHVASSVNGTATKLLASLGENKYFSTSGNASGPAILIEGGLNTTLIQGTAANRSRYLVGNNLVDRAFYIFYDNRFIDSILGPSDNAQFNNTAGTGDGALTLGVTLETAASISTDLQLQNYSAARIKAPANGIIYDANYGTADTTLSAISGPRSCYAFLNLNVKTDLSTEFNKYGTEDTALPSASDGSLYDSLTTIVYMQGTTTGMQLQIPIKIVKWKSTP